MAPVNEYMDLFWHDHPLCYKVGLIADGCEECHKSTGNLVAWSPLYECSVSKKKWHPSCVPSSPESINHPCHSSHPLELCLQGPPNYANKKCSLCQQKLSNFIYHCKLCDFSVDINCAKNPPPVTVDHPKCHDHGLTLMGRDVSFTCNACGTHGERNPYVCLPCSLMFHYDCIDLPHVININRHDHRISHAYPLSPKDRVCEVCRQDITWRYGAYSCNKCEDFSVHSLCATRRDVWDGKELEGVPEEDVETLPFKEIQEGVINHLFHEEHNLSLVDGGEGIHCEACSRPVSSEKHYKCTECDFLLHQKCASLPLRKRNGLSTRVLTLHPGKENRGQLHECGACGRVVSGFRYEDGENIVLDVHCASLSWFKNPKLHPHALFLTTLDRGTCVACDKTNSYVLSCIDCEYKLDFKCATLPVVIKHRCDDHPLVLSRGDEKVAGKYWCTVCEAETNPEKWFYTCYDCGVVCHIDCVTGDSLNIKPGLLIMEDGMKIEAVLNGSNSRPLCSTCGSRCRFPMVYSLSSNTFENLHCSIECVLNYCTNLLFC